MSERQPLALTSTPYLRAAARMRRHAASRSASLTPSTWSNRAIALRTWLASFNGSLRSFGNAKVERDILFLRRVVTVDITRKATAARSVKRPHRSGFADPAQVM